MKTLVIYDEPRPVTLGELCEALSDGAVNAMNDGRYYNVNKADVSRFAEAILARKARREHSEAQSQMVHTCF